MRRWAWLVGTSVVLAACGIDVVGTDPAVIDVGGTDARANSDAPGPGPGQDARPNDDGGGQPIEDAGTDAKEGGAVTDVEVPKPQLIEDKIDDLRSIAISPTSLYIACTGSVIQWTGTGRQTVDAVKNARALAWANDQLFYVKDDAIGRYKSDTDRDEHTGEDQGVDVLFAGGRPVGSFREKIISYALSTDPIPVFNDINVLSGTEERPTGMASDNTNVFWTNRTKGFVGRSPLKGNGETLITGLTAPNSIVVDGNDLYIAHGNSIVKAPKGDGAPYAPSNLETVYTGIGTPMALAINGSNLYWLDAQSGSLLRAPRTGGSTSLVTTLAPGGDNIDIARPRLIAFEGNFVYWAQPVDKAVYRIQK